MKNFNESHQPIRQNGENETKSQKHEANLQKNSTLYFQLGLIICLLASYGLLEMKFVHEPPDVALVQPIEDEFAEIAIENFKVYEESKPKPKQNIKNEVKLIDEIEIIDDNLEIEKELEVLTSEQNTSTDGPINPSSLNLLDEPDDENVLINFIQNVPIYPGCEKAKNNYERRKCMSGKITKLIKRKFDGGDIASEYGLTGRQRIFVRFTIDKTGRVNNVETKAPNTELGEEAERVINLIPKMTPGKQNNKNVGVLYNLPITFQVD